MDNFYLGTSVSVPEAPLNAQVNSSKIESLRQGRKQEIAVAFIILLQQVPSILSAICSWETAGLVLNYLLCLDLSETLTSQQLMSMKRFRKFIPGDLGISCGAIILLVTKRAP